MKKLFIMALASMALTGCATKQFVNDLIAGVNKRMDGQNTELNSKIDNQGKSLDNRINAVNSNVEGVSRTAQEALQRAEAAGKLAEGKFLYETTLSSEIAFPFERSELTQTAQTSLDEFADKVKSDNKNVFIEIQGHTDSSGPAYTNLKMGEQRAEAVLRYLAMKHGFALHRMNAISYGETAPIADNKTRKGRIENRRVTLVVLQ